MVFNHLDAVAAVVLTLVVVWLHTHGWKLPVLGDALNVIVGTNTAGAASTPILDKLQAWLLDQLKMRLPHPSDVKPVATQILVSVGPDGKPVVETK